MTSKRQRLELTWIGKEDRPRLEPRILLEDPDLSYHAPHRVTEHDIFDNRLIFGDNLLALKALEAEFAGKIKCVFVDPPYRSGNAFTHYDDGLEHSLWLSMMRDRLELIRRLISEDGSLWITIDDREVHRLRMLVDELFGEDCFVATFLWRKVDSPNDNKVVITPDHEYILCYSRKPSSAALSRKYDPSILGAYRPPDSESDRPYRDRLLKKNGKNSLRRDRPSMFFPICGPDGVEVLPIHDDGREACWAMGRQGVDRLIENGELVWKQREQLGKIVWVPYTREFAPDVPMRPWPTIWNDLDTTRQTKSHQREIYGPAVDEFDTPKPEDLIQRVMQIASQPGDLVLDSFAGSGTTGAVAQKMGRRWIMVELGNHAHTHIIPRLKKVIDGDDPGGITKAVDWKGGGGFRYFRLAPTLLKEDAWGRLIVNPDYNAEMLAEAVCKLEGFTYAPSPDVYWQHGQSTERDYIYVTTAALNQSQLQHLSDEVGPDRTLLVCCGSFRASKDGFPNLTIRKIPHTVLNKCEWGRDDYSLEVSGLPDAPTPMGQQALALEGT